MHPNERNDVSPVNPDDPDEVQALLQQLAASMGLLPQEIPDDVEPPPEGAIALPVIEQDGTEYVTVFTSEEALVSAGADPQSAVQVPIAQLASSWPEGDLWLAVDPATDHGLTLPPDVVRALPGLVGAGRN
jgi:hypothetical protein